MTAGRDRHYFAPIAQKVVGTMPWWIYVGGYACVVFGLLFYSAYKAGRAKAARYDSRSEEWDAGDWTFFGALSCLVPPLSLLILIYRAIYLRSARIPVSTAEWVDELPSTHARKSTKSSSDATSLCETAATETTST